MTIEMERDKLIRSIASARTALNTIALMLQGAVVMMEEQVIDESDWASIYNLEAASKEIIGASSYIDDALETFNKIK